jgi:hypothetical protein
MYRKPVQYLTKFAGLLRQQLNEEYERTGEAWKEAPREGLEYRTIKRINGYWRAYQDGAPLPWLKIAALALVGHLRENHPEGTETMEAEDEPNQNS